VAWTDAAAHRRRDHAAVDHLKGLAMSTVQDTRISDEVRRETLDHAVADLEAEGWQRDPKRDNERVLVGHNEFRRLLVKRRRPLGTQRELVEVDRLGRVSVTRV
jgi:hypothetical protein